MRRPWRVLLLAVGCGLFAYLVDRLGVAEIVRPLLQIKWYFALAAAIYAAYDLTRTLAYYQCVSASGYCSYWALARLRVAGESVQFLTSTGLFLSEPGKMWLLKSKGLSAKHAVAATLAENLVYTFTSAALTIAGLTVLLEKFQPAPGVALSAKILIAVMSAFLAAAAVAIAGRIYLIGGILKGVRKLPVVGRRVRFADQDVREMEDLLFLVLRKPRMLSILAVEAAAQALLTLELFVFLRAAGGPSSAFQAFVIEGATKFVGMAFFFIPGQVGASEGAYALVFRAMGLAASAGFALAVARRLRSFLVAAVGLALAPLWRGR